MTWAPRFQLHKLSLVLAAFGGVAAIFSTLWPRPAIVEVANYFALWAVFPMFGVRLNYLAASLYFPLQDTLFTHLDALLGFDWRTWASLAWSHPALIKVLIVAYDSNIYQPFILGCWFAFFGPRRRNRELLTAMVIAALATVAISALLPAFGPNRNYGPPSEWELVMRSLRAGVHVPLPYVGIVNFPSYHSSMAVIFAATMRGSRYGFALSALVNGLMILATIPFGYHYPVDVIAGCAISIGSDYVAIKALKRGKFSEPV